MYVGFEQGRKGLVDQAVSLQWFQALEARGHDLQVKVPLAGRAGMTGVRATVVADFQISRAQALLQQALDLCGGRRPWRWYRWHLQATEVSVREDSHSACAIANNTKAAVKPITLKLTQARSLIE
jgi:hypothetical protein